MVMPPLSLFVLVLFARLVCDPTSVRATWQTLSGTAPLVIAHGGTSGLYPDQTENAYTNALSYSLPGVVLTCDLQFSKGFDPGDVDGTGICRTGLDLSNSTYIDMQFAGLNRTYAVNGVSTNGYFAIDIPYSILRQYGLPIQSVFSRASAFDQYRQQVIWKPEYFKVANYFDAYPNSTWWLNCEYTDFVEANSPLNATLLTIQTVQNFTPGYVSAPDISLLTKIQASNSTQTKIIYKFLETATSDSSTGQTYQSLLQNLTYIRSFASGILVPRSYIFQVNNDSLYLDQPTTLVQNAHAANLEVYVYNFANDNFFSYNNTFDPIKELLYFIDNEDFSVDGLFTDYPTTASEAISCYSSNTRNGSSQIKESITKNQTIISHNGNSGQFPGATTIAYESAIDTGVDYIDCIVQITSDSVPICRSSADLLESTNVGNTAFLQQYGRIYPELGSSSGVYTFDLTYSQIQTLKSVIFSPDRDFFHVPRDPGYDGEFGILTLGEVLALAKGKNVGILIDIQNAAFIRNNKNLAVVDSVVEILRKAGYDSSDKVIMQSDESAVLIRLRALGILYPLMYQVMDIVSIDASDFAQIKQIASMVNLEARLLEPYESSPYLAGFLSSPPNLIDLAHEQNLTVFFQLQQNEPTAFAFDYTSDPTLQLFALRRSGVDGIITDFPTTVTNFLNNHCSGSGIQSSNLTYSIPFIVPADLSAYIKTQASQFIAPGPSSGPPPNLVVPEPPITGLSGQGPGSGPMPAAGSHLSKSILFPALSIVMFVVTML